MLGLNAECQNAHWLTNPRRTRIVDTCLEKTKRQNALFFRSLAILSHSNIDCEIPNYLLGPVISKHRKRILA